MNLSTLRTNYGHSGVKLFAPAAYWRTPAEEVDLITGGCGPGGFGDKFVPDKILWVSVFEACRIHDWMYHIGTTEEHRAEADRVFKNNMQRIVRHHGGFLRYPREILVLGYYVSVSYCGGPAFWDSKNDDLEMGTV